MKKFDEFVAYCQTLIGQEILTAGSRTTFTVRSVGNSVVFIPSGKNPQEPPRRDRTEAVLAKFAETNNFSPGGYSKDTRQASYILGVMAQYRNEAENKRLPAELLRRVTAVHLWDAIQVLLDGRSREPFGESTEYDLLTDEGQRLPPKAVFGLALGTALGRPMRPTHFSGGEGSVCFEILRENGYRIVIKAHSDVDDAPSEEEFLEGMLILKQHARRERNPAAAKAKKAQYFAKHGILSCERCCEDFTLKYGAAAAEACIEVHHCALAVSQMPTGYRTKLSDLQCLCANCHRVVHHELRLSATSQERLLGAAGH